VAVLVLSAIAGGCFRSVRLDPNETTKLALPARPRDEPVIVRTERGELREIDELDSVIVFANPKCEGCGYLVEKFNVPIMATASEGTFRISDARKSSSYDIAEVDSIVVRKLSFERTALVLGTALFAAGVAGLGVAAVCRTESSDCDPLDGGIVAAVVAAPLTLIFTLPLTKPLGEPAHQR
jgi:hypothetical protein